MMNSKKKLIDNLRELSAWVAGEREGQELDTDSVCVSIQEAIDAIAKLPSWLAESRTREFECCRKCLGSAFAIMSCEVQQRYGRVIVSCIRCGTKAKIATGRAELCAKGFESDPLNHRSRKR